MIVAVLILVALLAYANGSNDNSKGVATLVGFGAATPKQALIYATFSTALGAAVAFWYSSGMLKNFSTGLFAAGTPLSHSFFVAVLIGAFGWVIFATFTGLPVSTTHAIMGALIGAGLVAFGGSSVQWHALSKSFLVPLAVSPLLSMLLVYVLAWPVVGIVKRLAGRCVCVADKSNVELIASSSATAAPAAVVSAVPALIAGTQAQCEAQPASAVITTSSAANAIHWFSGGMVGFARGWNDAPKIAALCLIALPKHTGAAFVIVAIAMAVGGLVSGRRVLQTLAKKLTPLPLPEALTASLTTACLVGLASWNGLPVSTTHVSTGAIIGAGIKNDPAAVRWTKVGEIALSWLITLPAAGLLAAAARLLLR
jgi:inorganic phosphate transporter, PiT family